MHLDRAREAQINITLGVQILFCCSLNETIYQIVFKLQPNYIIVISVHLSDTLST